MKEKIICLVAIICLGLLCASDRTQADSQPPKATPAVNPGVAAKTIDVQQRGVVFDPIGEEEAALPEMGDLPVPPRMKKSARQYTGIIKNKTGYDVAIPSRNSGATLAIPARGWTEYISWDKNFDLTVYQDGKPFYCLQIMSHPREYAYMCKKYDFIAEIVKPVAAPAKKHKPVRKKKRLKRKPKSEGVEAFG
jgi:hypothetical protein